MGNIQKGVLNKIYQYNNDNPSTRSQQNKSNQMNSDRITTSYNPKKESLIQLTVSDSLELHLIMDNLALYSKASEDNLEKDSQNHTLKYSAISGLKEYYRIKKQGYCTNQYLFYLIFYGCSCCSLKDQFGSRRISNKKFRSQQILSILKTFLTGIYIYTKSFKRTIQKIDIDDIGLQLYESSGLSQNMINRQNDNTRTAGQYKNNNKMRMYFIDPWLKQKRQQQTVSVNQVNILLQNPSPQRLQAQDNSYAKFNSVNQANFPFQNQNHVHSQTVVNEISVNQGQLQSLLFSVGVIGLKLLELAFVDDIYIKYPTKKINLQRIQGYLQKHLIEAVQPYQNQYQGNNYRGKSITNHSIAQQKLIDGLRILLLSKKPKQRQSIYDFWRVDLYDMYELNQVSFQYNDHIVSERVQGQRVLINNQRNAQKYVVNIPYVTEKNNKFSQEVQNNNMYNQHNQNNQNNGKKFILYEAQTTLSHDRVSNNNIEQRNSQKIQYIYKIQQMHKKRVSNEENQQKLRIQQNNSTSRRTQPLNLSTLQNNYYAQTHNIRNNQMNTFQQNRKSQSVENYIPPVRFQNNKFQSLNNQDSYLRSAPNYLNFHSHPNSNPSARIFSSVDTGIVNNLQNKKQYSQINHQIPQINRINQQPYQINQQKHQINQNYPNKYEIPSRNIYPPPINAHSLIINNHHNVQYKN